MGERREAGLAGEEPGRLATEKIKKVMGAGCGELLRPGLGISTNWSGELNTAPSNETPQEGGLETSVR